MPTDHARWMAAALALARRGRGRTAPNPNVGCVIVDPAGRLVGRGWTQPGGRPHAEAMALAQAGAAARGATAYVTLEPCAHASARGPACSDLLATAGIARVVTALTDPDPRTAGAGHTKLRVAGIVVTEDVCAGAARRVMAGFLTRLALGRPQVTLKLATSADGRIATPPGQSQWLTGPVARAHGHLERARHEAILVGRGTLEADAPRLDVRLAGLEMRSPLRLLLTRRAHPSALRAFSLSPRERERSPPLAGGQGEGDWFPLHDPTAIADLSDIDHLLVEGGAQTAAAFLAADLVDRILWYRAPMIVGAGQDVVAMLGLDRLDPAGWAQTDTRRFGPDTLEIHHRIR